MPTKDAVTERPSTVFDLDRYVPFYLNTIANRWTASASQLFLEKFGIGIVEWRVLVALDTLGQASALDAVRLAGIDAGAASRAMRSLSEAGLIATVPGRFVGRTKPYALTQQGEAIYHDVLEVAIERETVLLKDLSKAERATFLTLLRRVHAGLHQLQDTPADK